MIPFNTSDAACAAQNGVNANLSNYYMLHVWVLADMTFEPDVFAGMMPCIFDGTAIHDANHSCHTTRTGPMGHSMDVGDASTGQVHHGHS